jgi:hypothetical protein
LAVLAAELRQRRVVVAVSVVWRFFRAGGISFKKSLRGAEQARPDVARGATDGANAKDALTRRGWSSSTKPGPRQAWCEPMAAARWDTAWSTGQPTATGKTLTFVAALRADPITAPALFDGPINARSILAYVQQALAKALKPADIVIMDNLGSHKGQAVRRVIRKAGAKLFLLPPTAPT